jgi:hypothetical protein
MKSAISMPSRYKNDSSANGDAPGMRATVVTVSIGLGIDVTAIER